VNNEKKKGMNLSTIGIVVGIFFVLVSIIWVTVTVIAESDSSGDDVTWVG
jgi:hypothetical protein